MHRASVHYFDSKSKKMNKKETLYWNKGTSEFPLLILFLSRCFAAPWLSVGQLLMGQNQWPNFNHCKYCTFSQILREHIPRHDFSVEQGLSVFPKNYLGIFFKKIFIADGGQILGGFFTCGINDQIIPRLGEFHKCLFQWSKNCI